jgi:hypothetical protein
VTVVSIPPMIWEHGNPSKDPPGYGNSSITARPVTALSPRFVTTNEHPTVVP